MTLTSKRKVKKKAAAKKVTKKAAPKKAAPTSEPKLEDLVGEWDDA